jgi:hypothetical protein
MRILRLAYDQGVLEIMSPHFQDDADKAILSDIARMAMDELIMDFVEAASTTIKREVLKRGV